MSVFRFVAAGCRYPGCVRRAPDPAAVEAVASLLEPLRRGLFDLVAAASEPVTREEAAARVGISRKLAAFHLDKLVAAGLLEVETAPTAGRVGRRPRVYRRAAGDVAISIPARQPLLLARLLLAAVSEQAPGEDGAAAARRISRAHGHHAGATERARIRPGRVGVERALALVRALLERLGYEPSPPEPDRLGFAACPFHPLASESPELVCGIHHSYVTGLVEGLGATTLDAGLVPGTDACCVEVRARRTPAAPPSS
jgi:predicted ArsR family transcriptional regulator